MINFIEAVVIVAGANGAQTGTRTGTYAQPYQCSGRCGLLNDLVDTPDVVPLKVG